MCRSPVAAHLLQRELDQGRGADEPAWLITSAGLAATGSPMDPNTVAAAARAGVDLSTHSPRRLDATILATDGADLVLAMTRTVLREITAIDPRAWPRTFTIKELARLAAEAGPARNGESFDTWLSQLAEGRQTADRVTPSRDDDVDDPYGGPRRDHERMVDELSHAVASLVRYAPWGAAGSA